MPTRRSWAAVLLGVVGCAQIVGLDELREEPESEAAAYAGAGNTGSAGSAGSTGAGSAGSAAAGSGGAGSTGSAGNGATLNASAGSAGSTSTLGREVQGGVGAAGGAPDDGSDTGDVDAGPIAPPECSLDVDCDDGDPCTTSACRDGQCAAPAFAAPGTPCGSAIDDACTNPDSCDGQGVCQPNDAVGTACEGGTCAGGVCIAVPGTGCAVDSVGSVPFTTNWSSVGRPDLYDGGCDTEGTRDYALVFSAPSTGIFRITSTALVDDVPYSGPGEASGIPDGPADGDSVMTIARGNCAGPEAGQLACNDDVSADTLSSQIDLDLAAGEVVTIYLNELAQTNGGTGTVSIVALP